MTYGLGTAVNALKRLIVNALFRVLPTKSVVGIRCVNLAETDAGESAIRTVAEALSLLDSSDEVLHRRVRRFVKQIVIWPGPFTAAVPPITVELSTTHTEPNDILEIASVLVHEATHLEIAAWGIPYDGRHRERIEHLCVKEQAGFLRRIGGRGATMADIFEESLAKPWWTPAAHRRDIAKLHGWG
jgi:hypothetical protein